MSRVELIVAKNLVKIVRPLIFDINQEGRQLHEEALGHVTCSRGCAYCCYQKQLANIFEGAVIFAQLENEKRWNREMEAKLLWADKAMTEATHFYWVRQSIPCVFLKETAHGHGECSVYPVRPMSCALSFSTNEDPRDCQLKGSQSVNVTTPTQLRILELKAALQSGADDEKLKLYTLPGAVLMARAKFKNLPPPPDIHTVELLPLITQAQREGGSEEYRAGSIRRAFDAIARLRTENDQTPP